MSKLKMYLEEENKEKTKKENHDKFLDDGKGLIITKFKKNDKDDKKSDK